LAWDTKTLTVVASIWVQQDQELYPMATVFSDHNATLADLIPATVLRLSDEVPRTSEDMSKMFKWEHGQKVKGTHAKEDEAFKRYRNDINKAYGNEDDYKTFFVDTFRPVTEQLKEMKK
jgi:hypothetical protein